MLNSEEFERYFNPTLLDRYVVVEDSKNEHGINCENYQCDHYLVIK